MLKRVAFVFSLAVCMVLSMVTPTFAGELHGTITWQYNRIVGTQGDNGAEVWLCPDKINTSITAREERDWIHGIENIPAKGLFCAKADGYGKYDIYGIPEGYYWIWIKSRNVSGFNPRGYFRPEEVLFQHMVQHEENYKDAKLMMNDGVFHIYIDKVKITQYPSSYSYDFG